MGYSETHGIPRKEHFFTRNNESQFRRISMAALGTFYLKWNKERWKLRAVEGFFNGVVPRDEYFVEGLITTIDEKIKLKFKSAPLQILYI